MKLTDIICKLEELFPLKDKMFEEDNIGLQVGNPGMCVKKVLISLDLTPEVASEAISNEVDLIIVHHPFIFNGINAIVSDDYFGDVITNLIKNDIALYVIHTNYDSSKNGMGYHLLKHLGVENVSFSENSILAYGYLENPMSHDNFISFLKEKFKLCSVKFSGNETDVVSKVGIIGGSGMRNEDLLEASNNDLDAYLSGDMLYKNALYSKSIGLNIYDIGHYAESIGFEPLVNILNEQLEEVEFVYSQINNPHFVIK